MLALFIAGILIDLYFGNYLGGSSLILLVLYVFIRAGYKYLPKRSEKNLRLKL